MSEQGTTGEGSQLGEYHIVVNARQKTVNHEVLTFRQVVKLAFDPIPTGENILLTVVYRNGPSQNQRGTMTPGDTVHVQNGMLFNVTATDKS